MGAKSGLSKANGRQNTRHKKFYDRYKNEERFLKNKARKILRHIKQYPWHAEARALYSSLPDYARKGLGGLPPLEISPVRVRADAGMTLAEVHIQRMMGGSIG